MRSIKTSVANDPAPAGRLRVGWRVIKIQAQKLKLILNFALKMLYRYPTGHKGSNNVDITLFQRQRR